MRLYAGSCSGRWFREEWSDEAETSAVPVDLKWACEKLALVVGVQDLCAFFAGVQFADSETFAFGETTTHQ